MAPIYSTKLVNIAYGAAFSGNPYVVPVGATVVVTNIDIALDENAIGQATYVRLGAAIVVYRTSAAIDIVTVQWQGKQVLVAGDTIGFTTPCVNSYLAITGYLLA